VGQVVGFPAGNGSAKQLYIVGDFIDGWQLRRKWYWTEEYNLLGAEVVCAKTAKQTPGHVYHWQSRRIP